MAARIHCHGTRRRKGHLPCRALSTDAPGVSQWDTLLWSALLLPGVLLGDVVWIETVLGKSILVTLGSHGWNTEKISFCLWEAFKSENLYNCFTRPGTRSLPVVRLSFKLFGDNGFVLLKDRFLCTLFACFPALQLLESVDAHVVPIALLITPPPLSPRQRLEGPTAQQSCMISLSIHHVKLKTSWHECVHGYRHNDGSGTVYVQIQLSTGRMSTRCRCQNFHWCQTLNRILDGCLP